VSQGGASEAEPPSAAAEARPTPGPPTELPAGVPRPAARRRSVLLVAGITGVAGLVVGILGVRALVSRPAEQHGLVASAAASSAGAVEAPPSESASAPEPPPSPAESATEAEPPPATKSVSPSAADTKA